MSKSQHTEDLHCQNRVHDPKGMGGTKLALRFLAYLTRVIGLLSPADKVRPPLLPTIACYCTSEAELEVCRRLAEMMRVPHTIVQTGSERQPTCALTPLRHLEMELEIAGRLVIHFSSSPDETTR